MANALNIAKYLIGLGQKYNRKIDNLRLQKLLYYAWGTYWYENHQELFYENIEAWPLGPVVREVYGEFCNEISPSSSLSISDNDFNTAINTLNNDKDCHNNIILFLDRFDSTYMKYDTLDLVQSTREERPWKKTYVQGEKRIIDKVMLKDFFEKDAFE